MTPTPTATIPGSPSAYCDSIPEPALIPDNDPAGITRTILINAPFTITDLNVSVNLTHPFVGDLKIRLTHVDTATSVLLLDRPGLTDLDMVCGGADIAATFDDAAGAFADDLCAATPPAIDGSVQPTEPLSAFDGQSISGIWQLNLSDNAVGNTGALFAWCLQLNSLAPVVTAFTCNGTSDCALSVDKAFMMSFSFVDPNGDASAWHMSGRRDDGFEFDAADGTLTPAGAGSISVSFNPFTCPLGNCRQTEYDYFVTVTDATGLESTAQRVHLTVVASP
jgi:subtilisin-like proprotein convertase family protein